MIYRDRKFTDERIDLSEKIFHGCTFERCELVFDGHRPPSFHDNRFVDSVFVFTGPAVRTLYFLSNIYHAGDGGREVVEHTFEEIRLRAFCGSEIRTIAPPTVDHSLKG